MRFDQAISMRYHTGIYIIENVVNKHQYIGSAARCFYLRYHQHKSDLTHKKHGNRYLQAAWNKYGPEAFMFWVVEEHEPEFCAGMEHWWIQVAKPVYNLNTNTVTRLGAKLSQSLGRK